MNRVICKTGHLETGRATVTLQQGDTTAVIKSVPAQVWDNGGEHSLSEEMTEQVQAMAEEARRKGVELGVLRWTAITGSFAGFVLSSLNPAGKRSLSS